MHKICFTISFISCLYMFRAHVPIIRRSKLHYTASGIITPIDGRVVHRLRESSLKYLLEYICYMFRPVNSSSSGLQQSKYQVLFRYWDPNIFTVVNVHKIWYWIKFETYNVYLSQHLTNLMYKICFTISFISCLWYHHTYKCDDTRGCVRQFWPPDDEHMCSKHV